MQDFAEGESFETRELSGWEAEALDQLAAGEDLVTRTEPNAVRMLGALRSDHQCADCHRCTNGSLLGVFSYVLRPRVFTTGDAELIETTRQIEPDE